MQEGQLLRPRSDIVQTGPLLENRRFASLCLARFFSSTAQHAIYFALLIVVVERTGSSIHSGLLIFSFLLPGVLTGLYAGMVADRSPKRLVMFLSQGLRAAGCVAFFIWGDSLWRLYLLILGFATVTQFNSPAESAAVPAIVPYQRLASANALLNLTSILAQGAGMLALAPLFMKTVGEKPLFIVTALLFAGAAFVVTSLSGLESGAARRERPAVSGGLTEEFKRAWRHIAQDSKVSSAVIQLTLATTAILVLATLLPHYLSEVLDTQVDNAAFVFAPAGIGLFAGLRVAPLVGQRVGNAQVVKTGFLLFLVCLASLGFVEELTDLMRDQASTFTDAIEWTGLSLEATVAMGLSIPLGFAFSLVGVAARAVLHERVPADMLGRVFAMQMVLGSLASIIPLFIVGGMAELMSARIVISLVTVATLILAIYSHLWVRRQVEALARAA
ncbi:MAG: MFS transporter [Dehalococcoidia bacterium]